VGNRRYSLLFGSGPRKPIPVVFSLADEKKQHFRTDEEEIEPTEENTLN
jgi:hypothetical protein